MKIPHDFEAEECVLGACMLSTDASAWAIEWLVPGDFYKPSHSHAFAAVGELHRSGGRVDALTVLDMARRLGLEEGLTAADLVSMIANTPATSSVTRYGEIIQRHALARQTLHIAVNAVEALQSPSTDPAEYVEKMRTALSGIDSPIVVRDPGDMSLGDIIDSPIEDRTPWVVPGILRLDWRCMLVGVEGGGRSTMLRQLAICAAHGVHPFTNKPIPPQRTLIVDTENPLKHLKDWGLKMHELCAVKSQSDGARERCRVWHRPEGIDLRKRAHRAEFEDILRRHRPTLVCIGPLYKTFFRASAESYEEPALQMQGVFDDLRTRHGFALVIEHHAPHGQGTARDLRPEGSSLWLRWGELRFKLIPVQDCAPYKSPSQNKPMRAMRRDGFSGDRMYGEHAWPDAFMWGDPGRGQMPWAAYWDTDQREDF